MVMLFPQGLNAFVPIPNPICDANCYHYNNCGHCCGKANRISKRHPLPLPLLDNLLQDGPEPILQPANPSSNDVPLSRRSMLTLLASTAATATVIARVTSATAVTESTGVEPLQQLALGQGEWIPLTNSPSPVDADNTVVESLDDDDDDAHAAFTTYLTRFLIAYDPGVHQWWTGWTNKVARLSDAERAQKLTTQFAALANSIQQAQVLSTLSPDDLWDWLVQQYASSSSSSSNSGAGNDEDVMRQIAILFALLPPAQQPTKCLASHIKSRDGKTAQREKSRRELDNDAAWEWDANNYAELLPLPFRGELNKKGPGVTIVPALSSLSSLLDPAVSSATTSNQQWLQTPFGPLGTSPLTRELPKYSKEIYTLLGISGAVGCALTHSLVIPLDVVKTRAQTNPDESSSSQETAAAATTIGAVSTKGSTATAVVANKKNIVTSAIEIVRTEGVEALLLGAQATIVGYLYYGLSVYPSYAFFKRFLSLEVVPPDVVLVQGNNIALLAGALAAVVASCGLTPIEAARIRVVAEPDVYKPLGLTGTLRKMAQEDEALGWKTLYAGFGPLLTRQVIFGSVKFLAFERACEVIFAAWPALRDLTWTSLTVSLVAGGMSGILSSVVSQPADSVLTFVAQNSNNANNGNSVAAEGAANDTSQGGDTTKAMGLIEGCRIMIEQDGPGALFRGLGSRCVWAGSIIAGQFLLYDVFRTYFHVSTSDLSQVYHIAVTVQN